MRRNRFFLTALAAGTALLAACNDDRGIIIGPGDPPGQPRDTHAEYHWVLEGFTSAGASVGHPVVDVFWLPPTNWDDEVFRVYARRQGDANFFLVATVTSCTSDGCTYRDRNVTAGRTYEYYVAAADEDTDQETPSEFRETVDVPAASTPSVPAADSAVGLDNAAYVRWRASTGSGADIQRYIVYLTRIDNQQYLYHMGETDGLAFVDTRAENGHVYGYRIAAVDESERVSGLSAEVTVAPRPDASGELIYAFQDNAAESGFRFQTSEATNPILPGSSPSAHWRLESDASGWRIVPLNGTGVLEYPGRTTALACGPGADASCRAATRAPTAGYQTTPIEVNPEFSYVFRVTGNDGQVHYGVIRAQIVGTDASGRDLLIFDWAYQLIPNDVRLNRVGG